MSRKLIILGVVIASVIFGGYFLFRYLTTSEITITLSEDVAKTNPVVIVDEYVLQKGLAGIYKTKVGAGNHRVSVKSLGYPDFSEERRSFFRGQVEIKPSLKPLSANEVAKELMGDSYKNEATKAQFYGSNDWLIIRSGEGVGVARYYQEFSEWRIISDGTAIYLGDDRKDAPADLLQALGGILED